MVASYLGSLGTFAPPAVVNIRPIVPSDSLIELTELLHRAYAPLNAAGLNYTAVDQSLDVTRQRISRGECAVAELDGSIVGTIVAVGAKPNGGCPWYRHSFVATAHQLAVEPKMQKQGVGSLLMLWAEEWARDRGFRELAVDTAEPAVSLVAFYARRGYRFIEFAEWPNKRYRSVILSKSLANAP